MFLIREMGIDTSGEINFYSHTIDGSRPSVDATPTLGYNKLNFVQITTRVPIYDLRGRENDFHLDENGFELHQYHGNIHKVFDDHSEKQQSYYQEIENILKTRLGASRIVIFNHSIRFRGPLRPADQCDQTHKNPVFYPHVDNDPPAARLKLKEVLGEEEGEKRMKNRFQIINTWKPLGPNPIVNIPLTICDYQSIDTTNDVHSTEVLGSQSSSGVYAISRNTNNTQRWYYMSNMRSNEMFIFKIFDSDQTAAQFGAHTAFINENASSTNTEQCSIETRSLVFYDQ